MDVASSPTRFADKNTTLRKEGLKRAADLGMEAARRAKSGYSLMTLGAIDYQRKLLEITQRNAELPGFLWAGQVSSRKRTDVSRAPGRETGDRIELSVGSEGRGASAVISKARYTTSHVRTSAFGFSCRAEDSEQCEARNVAQPTRRLL